LAKLSPADRASAEKQHVCPVTGKMLGTMDRRKKSKSTAGKCGSAAPGAKRKS